MMTSLVSRLMSAPERSSVMRPPVISATQLGRANQRGALGSRDLTSTNHSSPVDGGRGSLGFSKVDSGDGGLEVSK